GQEVLAVDAAQPGGARRARRPDHLVLVGCADRVLLGRAGAYLRAAPRHVVDQLGVPHDRRAAVQGAGQVGELLAAGDPVARRVLAQPAPRRPDVRAARRQAWADRHLGADDLAVREVRLGLRRALADRTTAGAPGGEGLIGSASRRVD